MRISVIRGEHTPALALERKIGQGRLQPSRRTRRHAVLRSIRLKGAFAALVIAALTAMLAASASPTRAAAGAGCSFTLKIGTVLPFTGDLAPYGGNMDKAVRLA